MHFPTPALAPGRAFGERMAGMAGLLSLLSALALAGAPVTDEGDAELEVPSRLTAPPLGRAAPFPSDGDLLAAAKPGDDGRLVVERDGQREVLTIDPALQQQLTAILHSYQTPWAAVVAMDPATGRVLAMAEHSEVAPGLRGLCTRPLYPAASIFKIVTASALLEAGVSPEEQLCSHAGRRTVSEDLLEDSPLDRCCATVTGALATSANVIFAKLTARYLDPERLRAKARAFHFNQPLQFPVPAEPSLAAIPDETYGLSLAGAGFGDVYLSPLHGAALAAVAATGGLWRAPVLYEREVELPRPPERVLSPEVARQLADMLAQTVESGTARRIFHERGFGLPDAVGKTGSLADKRPFRDYTWFVGYAPKEHPRIAVAAVIVNDPYWRIRATWLGREAMRLYLTRPLNALLPAAQPAAKTTASAPAAAQASPAAAATP